MSVIIVVYAIMSNQQTVWVLCTLTTFTRTIDI